MKNSASEFTLSQELLTLVRRYGANANSFLGLYEGYRYFSGKPLGLDGAIAYVDTRHAWLGAAEPLASEESFAPLLEAFAHAAAAEGKLAMCLPASEKTCALAEPLGYGSIKIGGEPQFLLEHYEPSIDRVTTAKRLAGRGALVREIEPDRLPEPRRNELNELVEEWLETRKMSTLSFLNRVEPWALAAHKKYFYVELEGRVLAFVAAVPIPPRHGWYLVDLFRHRDSPPGSTELLILETMRLLKAQGATLISLGVAPLSELQPDPAHPRLIPLLRFIYERGNIFYNFKPLYQFKQKFHPTRSEAAYLIYSPAPLTWKNAVGLCDAFLGSTILEALCSGVERKLSHFHPAEGLRPHFSPTVAMRSMPTSLGRIARRCKLTTSLALINIVVFCATVDRNLHLRPEIASTFAFSIPNLEDGNYQCLLASSFLHWGFRHLIMNLFTISIFCGGLEYMAGPNFVALAYFIPALLANPLTSAVFFLPFRWLNPDWWESFRAIEDVGASLGIFGCGGALTVFFKRAPILLGGLAAGTLIYSALSGDPLSLNHITAAGIGLGIAHLLLGSPRFGR